MISAIPWPEPQPSLSRETVLARLCKILSDIYLAHDPHYHEANDCFCDRPTLGTFVGISTSFRHSSFRHSGQSIAWLEALVERELKRTSDTSCGPGERRVTRWLAAPTTQ